jgi:hypothetical protein
LARVTIVPETAGVSVDGEPAALQKGKLELSGAPGDSFVVRIHEDGRATEETVVLRSDGSAYPARIELPRASRGAPSASTKAPDDIELRRTWR